MEPVEPGGTLTAVHGSTSVPSDDALVEGAPSTAVPGKTKHPRDPWNTEDCSWRGGEGVAGVARVNCWRVIEGGRRDFSEAALLTVLSKLSCRACPLALPLSGAFSEDAATRGGAVRAISSIAPGGTTITPELVGGWQSS